MTAITVGSGGSPTHRVVPSPLPRGHLYMVTSGAPRYISFILKGLQIWVGQSDCSTVQMIGHPDFFEMI